VLIGSVPGLAEFIWLVSLPVLCARGSTSEALEESRLMLQFSKNKSKKHTHT
jgi:hypothetical protein